MIRALAMLCVLGIVLGGCAGGSARVTAKPAVSPRSNIVAVPTVMAAAGLQGVIGSPAAMLTRRFGSPRIDLAEGDARKLQFAGATCVLDIFLYPVSAGTEPTATHVEARIRMGGAAADAGACIREVERQ